MQVRVLFFGQLKEIVGTEEATLEASEGASVEDLFSIYAQRFPRLKGFRDSVAPAVNREYAHWSAVLRPGDEVALLPPVSGG
ncbi:MAG TPA: molybdopterin converting factor subunit 1 [Candidatus Acidoferrales bacterium]|nr:molybdopterin converting factor subunit 1 [Candidatus Acidoferrales bacterium]